MTTKDYGGITDSEIEPGKPITTSLFSRLRDDPLAAIQNDPAAISAGISGNWVPTTFFYTTPGSHSITVPDGVRRVKAIIVGGGGAGRAPYVAGSSNGGDSYVAHLTDSFIAAGGAGGTVSGDVGTGGAGGGTSGIPGLLGMAYNGQAGVSGDTGILASGGSGPYGQGSTLVPATGFGAGGGGGVAGAGAGGGAGGYAEVTIFTTPGDGLTVVVGAGGSGTTYEAGRPGLVILEF